jgi:hypothetical protein
MKTVKEVTVAGSTIFVKIRVEKPKRVTGEKRANREKATPEQIEKINQKNAERILSIILNYNFKPGDYHIVLTYSGTEPSKEQAKKDLEKFKREIMKRYRDEGIVLKWVTATEYENTRIHHHIVMTGGIDVIEIAKIWEHGFIRPVFLDDSGDYRKLAAYLIKETSKSFRQADAVSRRRYNCSRSIVRPMVNQDDRISYAEIHKDPKPVKGYYIDQDSIFRGKNPITGQSYLEYVMISLDPEPRIKKWNRGKKVKLRAEYFKINEHDQVEIDFKQMQIFA